ncbi:RNA-directed DNA polymerase-like protein [Gossypium australe]|uniref:RNA-directed DNA polymerase-like protein n=1 Tax=Gossypium australe TaxID=47621 RepID=A0A5B6WT62_9ROSI|nr:RNA-directed DNA polymerase-like protein [Gossypium australe]
MWHPRGNSGRSKKDRARYYRRFIEGFSLIATPRTKLLMNDVPFKWTNGPKSSIEKLKNVLT